MTGTESPFAIIAKYQTLPIEVKGIARELGLPVTETYLGDNIAGQIIRAPGRSRSGFLIFVNSSEHPNRQRFTIAHEIAHFILHRDLIEDGVTDDTLYRSPELSSYLEVQANRLAADILMPIRLLKREYAKTQDPRGLAKLFGVSPAAMDIRLKALSSASAGKP